jgi:glycerol uptake operon antiterminator
MFNNQTVLPALSNFKAIKKFLKTDLEYGILVDFQLAEIGHIIKDLKDNNKKILIHIDLIKGLKADEYGAIHLIQNHQVDGIISIKPKVIETAKKRGIKTMQRIFLKDSISLHQSLQIINRTEPDCVEILPGISSDILKNIKSSIPYPVYCGGLITTQDQVDACLENGASGVTSSNTDLWI